MVDLKAFFGADRLTAQGLDVSPACPRLVAPRAPDSSLPPRARIHTSEERLGNERVGTTSAAARTRLRRKSGQARGTADAPIPRSCGTLSANLEDANRVIAAYGGRRRLERASPMKPPPSSNAYAPTSPTQIYSPQPRRTIWCRFSSKARAGDAPR